MSALAFVLAAGLAAAAAADGRWPQWRGPDGTGCGGATALPVAWSPGSNLLWTVALPGNGCSTPCVWDGCVYVTAPVAGEDALLALDAQQGRVIWQTKLGERMIASPVPVAGCLLLRGAAHLFCVGASPL